MPEQVKFNKNVYTFDFLDNVNNNVDKDKSKTKKRWNPEDEFATVFANLNKCKKYARVFETAKDRKKLLEYQKKYNLNVRDLESISWEFQNWADGVDQAKLKSPRGTFATFCKNAAGRKPEKPKAQYLEEGERIAREIIECQNNA